MRQRIDDLQIRKIVDERTTYLNTALSGMEGVVKIIGNEQKPAIIYNNSLILSAYVKNFDLIFMSEPFQGVEVARFKLRKDFVLDKKRFIELIKKSKHRDIFKIQYLKSSLYFWGWKYLDYKNKIGKYPLFSRVSGKLFFTKEKARRDIEELDKMHYDCFLV